MPKKKTVKLPKIEQLPSGSYHVKVYSHKDETGKRIYVSFTDPDLSSLIRQATSYKYDKKIHDEIQIPTKLPLSQAISKYIDARRTVLSPTTIVSYDKIARCQLQSIMSADIHTLTQEAIQKAVNADASRLSPKTVRNSTGLLAAVLNAYRPDFRYRLTLPQKEHHTTEIPTEHQVLALIEAAKDTDLELPVVLAALCGLRRSEICALRLSDIDPDRRTIHVHRALVYDNKQWIEKPTKTTESTRLLPVYDYVWKYVQKYLDKDPAGGEYLCVRPSIVDHRFRILVNHVCGRNFNFHSLRHYFTSVMLRLDEPREYIEFYLGHNSDHMIQTVYGHPMETKVRQINNDLDRFYHDTRNAK